MLALIYPCRRVGLQTQSQWRRVALGGPIDNISFGAPIWPVTNHGNGAPNAFPPSSVPE